MTHIQQSHVFSLHGAMRYQDCAKVPVNRIGAMRIRKYRELGLRLAKDGKWYAFLAYGPIDRL